jgi:hypothetical protein
VSLEINRAPLSGCRFHFAFDQVFQATSYSREFQFLMVLNLNRAPKRLDAQKKDEHAQFSGSILGSVSSRPFGILSRGIRRFALIASQKSHDAFCFCLYRAVKSGRELVCAKKNLKLISRGIVQSLIATPRGRRTYPEKKSNRWRITLRCAVPQAKLAVSREPGSTLLSLYIWAARRRTDNR